MDEQELVWKESEAPPFTNEERPLYTTFGPDRRYLETGFFRDGCRRRHRQTNGLRRHD
jgi:hypothetical protein